MTFFIAALASATEVKDECATRWLRHWMGRTCQIRERLGGRHSLRSCGHVSDRRALQSRVVCARLRRGTRRAGRPPFLREELFREPYKDASQAKPSQAKPLGFAKPSQAKPRF